MTEQTSMLRGARLRAIRDALELGQGEFADRLNGIAIAVGLPSRYNAHDVSVRETGRVGLKVEDYAIVALIDPHRWSWHWLAFGEDLKQRGRVPLPDPRKDKPIAARDAAGSMALTQR